MNEDPSLAGVNKNNQGNNNREESHQQQSGKQTGKAKNKNNEIIQNQCDIALIYLKEIVLKEDSHTENSSVLCNRK